MSTGEQKTESEERLLMQKAAKGDRASFAALYERFKGPVMSYLVTLVRDRNLAEELAQETFLKAYRARETYEPKAKVSTWLWTIAKNTAFDHLAKKKEKPLASYENDDGEMPSLLDTLESPLPIAEAALIDELDRRAVEECMAELSDQERQIVGLRIFSDLSYEEISERFSLPLGSVKTKLFRAKAKLTECFRRGGHAG